MNEQNLHNNAYIGIKYPMETGAIPFSTFSTTANQFRLIAYLDSEIDIDILQNATDATIKRYPMYNVLFSKGKGCVNTVTTIDRQILVEPYCLRFIEMDLKDDQPKIKVMYKPKAIAVEVHHTVCDANGCASFLNTLIACYYRFKGITVDEEGIIPYDSPIDKMEFADGYVENSKKGKTQLDTVSMLKPYTIKGEKLDKDKDKCYTRISFNTDDLKFIKDKYGMTVHEFLVTAIYYTYLIFKQRNKSKRAINLQMPINLRSRFNSKTLRNFVGTIQFTTKAQDFESIAQDFRKFIAKATSDEELTGFLYKGYSLINKLLPIFPSFMGKSFLIIGNNIMGEKSYSTNLSNIGVIRNKLTGVLGYDFLISPPHHAPFCISSCSYGKECGVLFCKGINCDDFQNEFIAQLKILGLEPIKIENLD